MKIVSLDPGGKTGITSLAWTEQSLPKVTWTFDEMGPNKHHNALALYLTGELSMGGIDVLLVEAFDNRANAAAGLVSLEYIGVTEAWSQAHNVPITYSRPPEKKWATDAKLKSLRLWDPTKAKPHARDAARHIARYVCTKMKGTELQKLFLLQLRSTLK